MALTQQQRQAIVAGAQQIVEGRPLLLSSYSFWGRHGITGLQERQEVIARANAIAAGSAQAELSGGFGQLADVYVGTRWPDATQGGGPAETPTATVFARISYVKNGVMYWASWSQDFAWHSSLQDVFDALNMYMTKLTQRYHVKKATFSAGSFLVF